MKIIFYKSAICPRCKVVAWTLNKLKKEYPQIEVETVDVITQLARTRRDGIKGFPTLKIDDETLTGLILTPQQVREFAERRLEKEKHHVCFE